MKVIFVDVGNTCRSLMAKALARVLVGNSIHASSAGTRPGQRADAQSAIETLILEFKIDASAHLPQDVHSIDLNDFDYIIAIDDDRGRREVAEKLKTLSEREIVQWRIRDPFGRGDEYRPCADRTLFQLKRFKKRFGA